jgi:hypothetical protein
MKGTFGLAFVLLAMFAFGCTRPPEVSPALAQQPAPVSSESLQWEYKVKLIDEDGNSAEIEKDLAQLGTEGWELVAVSQVRSTVSNSPKVNHYSRCFFRRQKREALK